MNRSERTWKYRFTSCSRLLAGALALGAMAAPSLAQSQDEIRTYVGHLKPRMAHPTDAMAPSAYGPYAPRGGTTLYSYTVSQGYVLPWTTGGTPAGAGSQVDVYLEDVSIPVANLTVGGQITPLLSVCQIAVGVVQRANAPANTAKIFWTNTDETNTTNYIVVPPTLAGTATVTLNTTANTVIKLATLGDGINQIPGMGLVELDMGFVVDGNQNPGVYGTFAAGCAIGTYSAVTATWGWLFANPTTASTLTSGLGFDLWWEYDSDPSPQVLGPYGTGTTTPAGNMYLIVKGTPVAVPTANATVCCVAGATALCYVANSTAGCTKSGGSVLAGQTACTTGICLTANCCNVTTGVCTTVAGTSTCPSGQTVASGACQPTNPCTQPTPPGNDECSALGPAYTMTVPSAPQLPTQSAVGATVSPGYTNGINLCTFTSRDLWYLVNVPAAGSTSQYKISVTPLASSGDYTQQALALAVYDSCPAGPGGELANSCVDFTNPNSTVFTGDGATSYYVRVGVPGVGTTQFTIRADAIAAVACCGNSNGLCQLSNNVGVCPSGYSPAPGGATSCNPTPCVTGACCATDGSCTVGGSGCTGYQGDGSVCTPSPCLGACCNNVTFACTLANAAQCTTSGGTLPSGLGTVCTTAGICPAPANDACGAAFTLTVGTSANGSVNNATGADITSCSTSNSDVWFKVTPATTGNYQITTTPATTNDTGTAIALFANGCEPATNADLFCTPAAAVGATSTLNVSMTGGTTYLIRVGSFVGNSGQFSILVAQPAGLGACCTIGANCVVVAASTDCPSPAVYRGVNTTCVAPATQCPPGACCFPGSGMCNVTTQSFCNGVTGTWNAGDTTCTTTTCTSTTPGNDDCNSAFTITSPTYSSNVGTEAANNEGLPAGNCNSAAAQTIGANNSIWYTFTAPSNGVLNIQVNDWTGYDMIMAVFTGTCGALTEIGCFDEPEPFNVNATLTAGTTIHIMIAQFDTTPGGGWTSLSTTFSPSGTCCVGTTCTSAVTQASCTGTWTQTNAACGINTCVPPGICCRGSTCNTTTTQANCTTTGFLAGATFPAGPSCVGSTFNGCCYADYNKTGGVTVGDIFDFLNDWFAGSPFASVGGNGSPVQLAVQNIFDFLNAWFAGCQ